FTGIYGLAGYLCYSQLEGELGQITKGYLILVIGSKQWMEPSPEQTEVEKLAEKADALTISNVQYWHRWYARGMYHIRPYKYFMGNLILTRQRLLFDPYDKEQYNDPPKFNIELNEIQGIESPRKKFWSSQKKLKIRLKTQETLQLIFIGKGREKFLTTIKKYYEAIE
ncbi:MAG: hypothetical protein ACTSW4_04020, partial [Candidatus Ranarchaeia archaeon]